MSLEYSDGVEVEAELTALLEAAPAVGSGARIALERQFRSWPLLYHLSPERANLVRHLRFADLDVLELGAGFGGLSRHLAEEARTLTAVEPGPQRLAGLRARLRDLDNWRAVEARAEAIRLDRTFDVVCLVGVLEYAELFCRVPSSFPGDAFDYLLERAASFLAPDGVLLLAVENRLGIKYWTGAGEDHSGLLFAGPCGYPATPSVRTFARRELHGRLARAGLAETRWYYPFPDYKLPASILSPELVERDARLAVDLACSRPFATPPHPRLYLFPDYLALAGLAQAGLFAEFVNSFLVLAGRRSGSSTLARLLPDEPTLAWHYAPGRCIPVTTRIAPSPDGLVTSKRRRDPEPPSRPLEASGLEIHWRGVAKRPVASGEYLRHRLLRRLHFGDGAGFLAELERFLRWVSAGYAAGHGRLHGEAVDARVANATCAADGGYELFDLEWSVAGTIPATWMVLRNALGWLEAPGFDARGGFATLGELYERLVRSLGLTPNLERDVELEAALQSLVLDPPSTPPVLRYMLARRLANPFSPAPLPQEALGVLDRRTAAPPPGPVAVAAAEPASLAAVDVARS